MSYGSNQPSGWSPAAGSKTKRQKAAEAARWARGTDKKKSKPGSSAYGAGGYGGTSSGWKPSAKPAPKKQGYEHYSYKKPRFSKAEGFVGHPYGSSGSSGGGGKGSASKRVMAGPKKTPYHKPRPDKEYTVAWNERKNYKDAAARRAYRAKQGLYKGRYYGPDAFKGSEKLNAAWEKSGKKGNPREFMKRFKG